MVSPAAVPQRVHRARLRRRTDHRLLAGVAGGIADSLNAPVAFVRFFILLAFAWAPWTMAAYAGAALLMPARDRSRPDWDNLVGAGRLGLVFAVPWLASPSMYVDQSLGGHHGWWIASYGLIAAGAALLFSADYRRGRPRSPEEARSTVIAALPVAGCAGLLAAGIVLLPDVRWERVAPLVAIAGAAALLLRPRREYVAPAMLALAATAVVVASGARLDGGVGDVSLKPRPAGGEPIVVRRAAGNVELDLRRLGRSAQPVEVEASVGRGDLGITVPRRAWVDIDARVGRGELDVWRLPGETSEQGFDRRVQRVLGGRPGAARLRVVADVAVGALQIYRSP